MRLDSTNFIRRCDRCQCFAQVSYLPPDCLTPILYPLLFMKWGMNIIGKLPIAPRQRVYMLAITDYLTKWIEGKAFHQVHDCEVKNFI